MKNEQQKSVFPRDTDTELTSYNNNNMTLNHKSRQIITDGNETHLHNYITKDSNNIVFNSIDELFNTTRIFICDTEVLEDYFSFQFKLLDKVDPLTLNNKNIKKINDVYIFECFSDEDCNEFIKFYNSYIMKKDTFLYFYNKQYDKGILNILLSLKNTENILKKVRRASDYMIINHVDYAKIVNIHWTIILDKNICDSAKENMIIEKLKYENNIEFWKEYKEFFTNKSEKIKGIKIVNCVDIPTSNIKNLTIGKKNGKPLAIGLKTIQLALFNEKISFDFNKYTTVQKIKTDGIYNDFLLYSANDVNSSEKIFNKFVKQDIVNRYYAIKAVNESEKIDYKLDTIFSEKNTALIQHIFAIADKKEPDIDYTKYIKSENKEFTQFVAFLNDNKRITSEELNTKYTGNREINLNGCICKIGLGGIHGVKNNYKTKNLVDLDYEALYPNLLIKHKEIFRSIMNVDLYEKVLHLRIKYKDMSKDKAYTDKEREEYNNIQNGLKLLLNSSYGIINSPYGGVNCKPLGLFICLLGQAITIKMVEHNKDLKPINVNTDGTYFEVPSNIDLNKITKELYELTGVNLSMDKFKSMLQVDVNSYIARDINDKLRIKGIFNISFKQEINKGGRIISNITKDAIKLLNNEDITIEPIFFKGMMNLEDKPYYFSNCGIPLQKETSKDYKNIIFNNEIIRVTDDINKADLTLYKKYAEIRLNQINNFDNKIENKKCYIQEITQDTSDNNKLKNTNINRIKNLLSIDVKQIGYKGYNGNIKASTYNNGSPCKPLLGYTKTELKNSTETKAISVESKDNIVIIDVDVFNKATSTSKDNVNIKYINKLKSINTYKTWNTKTQEFNCKLIFLNDNNKIYEIKEEYKKYIEILDNGVVWSLNNPTRTYQDNNIKASNISEYSNILDELLTIKNDNAINYIAEKEEIKHINETTNKDLQIEIAINLIKKYKIDIYDVNNNSIGVSCPYCNINNTKHYQANKGKIDAYVNINANSKGFKLHIHNLSSSCQNDTKHLEFYEKLNIEYQELLPSLQVLKQIELQKEITANINIELLNNLDEKLLIENTLRVVGTGGHKTFQSARKMIENVFVNKIFHIHSTKENKHISDFEREIKKILSMVIIERTILIDNYLEDETQGLKELGIHKLIAVNGIDKENIPNIRGVVTNHVYWYINGHTSTPNRNMGKIIEYINQNDIKHEIVIDEYESFKDKGIIDIQLNGYKAYRLDYNDKTQKIYKQTDNCLYHAYKSIEGVNAFEFAIEFNKNELVPKNTGVSEWEVSETGNRNLQELIDKYTIESSKVSYDYGRRERKCIKKNNFEFGYITVDEVTQLETKDIPFEEIKNNDFLQLIKQARGIAIIRKIIKVGEIVKDDITDTKHWGENIRNLDDLTVYGSQLESNNISFKSFKDQLSLECGKELFINYLYVINNSTLNSLTGTKYYLTANVPEHLEIPVNKTLEYKSSDHLKSLQVCVIDRLKGNDNKILNSLELLKDRDFKTLAFVALGSCLNSKELQNNGYDTKHWIIRGTTDEENGRSKTISYNTNDSEIIDDSLKQTVVVSYINGTESQGRSYSQSELTIINCVIQVNIKGRVSIDTKGKILITSIQEETNKRLKQALGRIYRGEQEKKACILIGDPNIINDFFKSYPENFSIEFNIEKYNKIMDRDEKFKEGMSDIVNYYEYILGHSKEEVNHFNTDNRGIAQNKRNIKYDDKEIYMYYKEKVNKHYVEHKKKLKDTEILPEIINKYGISGIQFKRIKAKFKES